jgi:hypothetical protein
VEDGVTGFIVESLEGAVAAVPKVMVLDHAEIRRRFEERFTAERMARDYVSLYQSLGYTPIKPALDARPRPMTPEAMSGLAQARRSFSLESVAAA